MKKFLLIILIFILILPSFASDTEDSYQDWLDHYYKHEKSDDKLLKNLFEDLTEDTLDKYDFMELADIYEKAYPDKNSSEINDLMNDDFRNADEDNSGKLTFDEFKSFMNSLYKYSNEYMEFKYFKEIDTNRDDKITLDEFEEISYIFTEDAFWDGYSIEEICQDEFDRLDDGNNYLTFDEFKKL